MRTFIAIAAAVATLIPVRVCAADSRAADQPLVTTVSERVIRDIRRMDTLPQGTPLRSARMVTNDLAGPLLHSPSNPQTTAPTVSPKRGTPCCWTSIMALRQGQTIIIELAGRQHVRGRVISVDHDAVTLVPAGGGDARRIERPDVVSVKAEPSRRMVVGGVVLAAGAGLLIADLASRPSETLPGKFWLAGMPLAIGGGAAVYQEKRRTGLIYRYY